MDQNALPVEQLESLSDRQALEEEFFLGLRQLGGIDLEQIEKMYGVSLGKKISSLECAGLVERDGKLLRLVPKKLAISNEVFVELLD
jgi:oxygen-independent coproporphyrinogen-3 oxidase